MLIKRIKEKLKKGNNISRELLYCERFKSVINGSKWFRDVSLAPGNWAIGYPYFYCLYRILNELHPQCILETGLGQSSKMINAYLKYNLEAMHYVCEHDLAWVDFVERDCAFTNRTIIKKLDLIMGKYKNYEGKVNMYKDFEEQVCLPNVKYDLVSIDGPFYSKNISRIDCLNLIPNNLNKSFIIMLDDYQQKSVENLAKEILKKLDESNIAYVKGTYYGEKQNYIIASSDNKWVVSM